jgi:hypothetical protein
VQTTLHHLRAQNRSDQLANSIGSLNQLHHTMHELLADSDLASAPESFSYMKSWARTHNAKSGEQDHRKIPMTL